MFRVWTVTLLSFFFLGASRVDLEKLFESVQRSVFSVTLSSLVGLDGEIPISGNATGFVVADGYAVTNAHVVAHGAPLGKLTLTFSNGTSIPARVAYSDLYHDFAILRFDWPQGTPHPPPLLMTSGLRLRRGQEVFLIGNSEAPLRGVVLDPQTTLTLTASQGFSAVIEARPGTSGSPVLDRNGYVVGVLSMGNSTSTSQLAIDYILDALGAVRRGKLPQRGDLGIVVDSSFQVTFVLPWATHNLWKIGDVPVAVNGHRISNHYELHRMLDRWAGRRARVSVRRQGKILDLSVRVTDLERFRVNSFVRYEGATLHNVGAAFRFLTTDLLEGVVLNGVISGSSLVLLGNAAAPRNGTNQEKIPSNFLRRSVLTQFCGFRLRKLKDLVAALRTLQKRNSDRHCLVVYRDGTDRFMGEQLGVVTLSSFQFQFFQRGPVFDEWRKVP